MKRFTICVCAIVFLLGAALVWYAALPRERAEVWIFTYHAVSRDETKWGLYTISPEEFESDLRYLKEHNYHTVTPRDLVSFVMEGKALPENAVMLTFDDGYRNNYDEVFPLLQKYEMHAVISLVGEYIDAAEEDDPNRSFLTWREVKEMSDSEWVEIANHSWALHRDEERYGSARMQGEDLDAYQAMLSDDVGTLQEKIMELTGRRPVFFAYPYGAMSAEAVPVLKELGIQATSTTNRSVNHLTFNHNLEQLFGLSRYNRPHGVSSDSFSRLMEA